MAHLNIDELYRELEATDEGYVRRKLSMGGYSIAQEKHVQDWLSRRDNERAEMRAAHELAVSRRTSFWSMIGAFGTIFAVLVSIAIEFMRKA